MKIIALKSLLQEHGMTHHREEKLVIDEVEEQDHEAPEAGARWWGGNRV